jgi:hypothetical protein
MFRKLRGKIYITELYIVVELGSPTAPWIVGIPKGTTFNVSIPNKYWFLKPYQHNEKLLWAALIHDYLLKQNVDRQIAAGAFHRMLVKNGIPRNIRRLLWLIVGNHNFS